MSVFDLSTANRFSAVSLDLSRLAAPVAIRGMDYETILADRLTRLKAIFDAAGIDYNADSLESDPVAKLQETDAYRELITIGAINDSVRSVMIAFAVGSDLDQLGAFYATARLSGESDADYRRRVLLAPEAFSAAGTVGAYTYHALASSPDVRHVDVWSPAAGQVVVAVQSKIGSGRASDELVETVRSYLSREDIKPLTDVLNVRSCSIIDFSIDLTAYVIRGPAPDAVKAQITDAINAMVLSRKTPARDVPISAILAAAHVGAVDKVVVKTPVADVATGSGEVANLLAVNVKVVEYDG